MHRPAPARVLLVEESAVAPTAAHRALETAGHTVVPASGEPPSAAMLAPEVQAVVVDAGPEPAGRGVALAAALAPRVPVVLLADHLAGNATGDVLRAGVRDCLPRDRADALGAAIDRALAAGPEPAGAALPAGGRLLRLVENAPDVLFRYRLHPDRAFEFMSPATTALLGYTPEEHYADPDLGRKLVHPDDLPALVDPDVALAGPQVVRWRHRDGRTVWTEQRMTAVRDEHGRIVAGEGVLRDITDRVRAEQALARREREFRLIAEHSPDIIARFDRELRHRYVNPVVEAKTGLPAEAFVGRTNRELGMPEALVEQWDRALAAVFETGTATITEFRFPAPDGRAQHFEARLVPETGPDGTVASVLALSRDVTDRHRDEQQLLETVERLRRLDEERRRVLDRLVGAQEEERKRIAADIHDDSIQVMVAAALRLESLAPHVTTAEGNEILGKLYDTVQRAITRLRRLMFELRPPQLDRDGLAPAIRTALQTSWDDDRGPEWEVDDRLGQAPSPELRAILYRIAQEAIANVRRHAEARRVTVLLEDAERGLRMRVQDDGRGFDLAAAAQSVRGHMGLMSMRERAELAGGWLQLRSTPGGGTTVEVWVPAPARDRQEGVFT